MQIWLAPASSKPSTMLVHGRCSLSVEYMGRKKRASKHWKMGSPWRYHISPDVGLYLQGLSPWGCLNP